MLSFNIRRPLLFRLAMVVEYSSLPIVVLNFAARRRRDVDDGTDDDFDGDDGVCCC